MSNEVAALEAEIKDYKIQVGLTLSVDTKSQTNKVTVTSWSPSSQAFKSTRTMQNCKI